MKTYLQTKLYAPKKVIEFVESLATNMVKTITFQTNRKNITYTKYQSRQLKKQSRHLINHFVNSVFYKGNELDVSESPYFPFPLSSEFIRKNFNLLMSTSQTKECFLLNGQSGFLSFKKANANFNIFEYTGWDSTKNECTRVRLCQDVYEQLCTLFLTAPPNDLCSYDEKLDDIVEQAKVRVLRKNIDITAIHSARRKNPMSALYKCREISQETIVFNFKSGFKHIKELIKQNPTKKLYYTCILRKFYIDCLNNGVLLEGKSITDSIVETYLNYYVDQYGRMYDTLNFIGLPGSLKDALTPDYINFDMRSCYTSIMSHFVDSSYYKIKDHKRYFYKKLNIALPFKDATPILKVLTLREQFSSAELNDRSEVVEMLKAHNLGTSILKDFNNNVHIKDLRAKTIQFWDKRIVEQSYTSPRGLSYALSGTKNAKRKVVATATLQGLEANLIDNYVFGLTKHDMDTISKYNSETSLSVIVSHFKNHSFMPWSSIEHDGLRVHKKHLHLVPSQLKYGTLAVDLVNKTGISINLNTTNSSASTYQYTNSTLPNPYHCPLNELGHTPLNGVDTHLDVCRNAKVYNNSQFYEKFMVSKTSDKQEIGMKKRC